MRRGVRGGPGPRVAGAAGEAAPLGRHRAAAPRLGTGLETDGAHRRDAPLGKMEGFMPRRNAHQPRVNPPLLAALPGAPRVRKALLRLVADGDIPGQPPPLRRVAQLPPIWRPGSFLAGPHLRDRFALSDGPRGARGVAALKIPACCDDDCRFDPWGERRIHVGGRTRPPRRTPCYAGTPKNPKPRPPSSGADGITSDPGSGAPADGAVHLSRE
mmetsp:Transcript_34192/g.81011  ORF Transcript_34192/g.81011 Transcript_34192/m.81011 type:complete len:214 (-) Transcript_34192:101-742(-)